jgi:hypothetical protein
MEKYSDFYSDFFEGSGPRGHEKLHFPGRCGTQRPKNFAEYSNFSPFFSVFLRSFHLLEEKGLWSADVNLACVKGAGPS